MAAAIKAAAFAYIKDSEIAILKSTMENFCGM